MKKKILIILLVLVFIYCIGGVIYSIVVKQVSNKKTINENTLVKIANYDYTMDTEVATSLFKENFMTLKSNLESDSIDYKSYASDVAKLYIIDFYTLTNKINKYDIGSIQFIYSDGVENFKLKASETVYKYLIDNTNNDRVQELPEVSEIFIENIEESTYIINSEELPAYKINLNWIYKKELGYDESAEIILVNKEGIISVVEENRMVITE